MMKLQGNVSLSLLFMKDMEDILLSEDTINFAY
jgi:hypothetical protein